MKNYSSWMNFSNNEEVVFNMCEKSSVKINNSIVDYEAIVNDANEWQKDVDNIFLIKKSTYEVKHGDVITYKNQNYLVFFIPEDRDFFLSSKARLCNSIFPIKRNKTRVLKGTNEYGKPIYQDSYDTDIQEPCVVVSKNTNVDNDKQLSIPENQLLISIRYQQSDTLALNYEFDMYNSKYKIINFDYTNVINDKGILKITAERV